MKFKAIIVDVDGTLIAPGESPIKPFSKRLKNVLQRCRNNGICLSIATARSLYTVKPIIKQLAIDTYVILENGARIYDPCSKTYTWQTYIGQKDAKTIRTILHQQGIAHTVFSKDTCYTNPTDTLSSISKIVIADIANSTARKLIQELQKKTNAQAVMSIANSDQTRRAIHITSQNATKGRALTKVAKLLSLSSAQIVSIGDSENDIDLFKKSGYTVAMGNAVSSLKKQANFIAPLYSDDGVAAALEHLMQQ